VQRSQIVKQADVVALLAMLPDECGAAERQANFQFYAKRCAHGSSLSKGMHALVAAQLGDVDNALRYFRETAAIDMHGASDSVAGGVHIAALGGLWQAAVFGFAGVTLGGNALGINPHLPPGWQRLGFCVHWRGRLVRIDIDQTAEELSISLVQGDAMPLEVAGKRQMLTSAATYRVRLSRRVAAVS
jgi:trehalose/maltose hydrolase-like predicted phosphorylase